MILPTTMQRAVKMAIGSLEAFDRDWPGVRRMLLDSRVGWPNGRLNGPRGSEVADPTGDAALVPDEAVAALQRVSELIRELVAHTVELDGIRRTWKPYAEPPRPCVNCPSPAVKAGRCQPCYYRHYRASRATVQPHACQAS